MMGGVRRFAPRMLLTLAICFAMAERAAAHPFHVSVAEAEWNAETKRLEVAMRVAPEDLESALTNRAETKVKLEESEDVDQQITDYLNAHFTLRTPKAEDDEEAKPLELHWLGKEISTKSAWLYFEIEAPDGVAGLELTNSMFVQEEETQINTVVVREGKQKTTLRFDNEKTAEVVRFESKAKDAATD
jgi:hypothetical protein